MELTLVFDRAAVMIHRDVSTLTTSGESETLEFKETTGTRRKAAMTICAFLNQSGGQVLFGVTHMCAERTSRVR